MLVTFYTNSFNRLPLVRNLLRSFEVCNEYPYVEWVITDYGSADGSREFLAEYAKQASFPLKVILGDERVYFASLKLPNLDRRTRFEAILRKYRNDARRAASGKLLFDIASDHQFIRRGNWVNEILEIFNHHEKMEGKDTISAIVPFGYYRWRLDKPNNQRLPVQNANQTSYYVAREKAYVDYSVMKKGTAQAVGPYFELTELNDNPSLIDRWYAQDPLLHPESEYARRCEKLGLKRVFMKYPILVTFKNRDARQIRSGGGDSLIAPLWTLEQIQETFHYLNRPVSSDELLKPVTSRVIAKSVRLFHMLQV